MSSLKSKLNRMKSHLIKDQQSQPALTVLAEEAHSKHIPFLEVWEEADTSPYFLDDEYCFIREVHYPFDKQHGRYQFKDFLTAIDLWNHHNVYHPLSAYGFKGTDLFFFDTETTGLGGGTGNTIFLLGYASFTDTEVVLKQHILPEPGLEVPLYDSFLKNVDYTTLVTYNGKAFDWPQVKTRHTLVREHVPKLPDFGHFDLYHAARRLWKDELESVKLTNVEKDILGFERHDDVPGFLAPMIYFDFVERKDPKGIIEMLKHNENDILSLITLYTHLSFQILQHDPLQSAKEKRLVGNWFEYIGQHDVAFQSYIEAAKEDDIPAIHQLAKQYKRKKDYAQAKQLWGEVVKRAKKNIQSEAYIELAKVLEHQDKDYVTAIDYTEKAIQLFEYFISLGSEKWKKHLKEAEKRLQRLKRKEETKRVKVGNNIV